MTEVAEDARHSCFYPDEARAAWPGCPPQFINSLDRYCNGMGGRRIRPGHFLSAVLENDLQEAIGHATPETLLALRDIVGVVYNHVPRLAWGSPDAVATWLSNRDAIGG